VVPRSKQLGRQPDKAMSSRASSWASSQTRRCRAAEEMRGPPSGRAQEGRRQPPDEVNGLRNYVVASCGRFLGIALDARGSRPKRLRSRACLFSISEQEQLVGPISPPAVSPHKREVIGGAPEWCAFGCWVTRRSSSRAACCSALFLGVDRRQRVRTAVSWLLPRLLSAYGFAQPHRLRLAAARGERPRERRR
jgi:hypothetical protein